jgi:hypothetical protein
VDPVSLIIAAVVAGAAAAAKDTASQSVKISFAALKELIKRRFGGNSPVAAAIESVERDPESDTAALKEQLIAAGADQDENIVRKAQELKTADDPDGARAGKYNVIVTNSKGVVIGDHATVHMTIEHD